MIPTANKGFRFAEFGEYGLGAYWSLRQSLAIHHKRYEDKAQPNNEERRDTRFTGSLGLRFRTEGIWQAAADFIYTVNNSTLTATAASDQRYQEALLRLSSTWSFKP